MFPLRDDNPTSITPIVTWILITINVIAFFYQISLGPQSGQLLIYQLGVIPAVISGDQSLIERIAIIPPALSLFTSMFLHGGWIHLIGNMWYLWIFGDNIEQAMGHLRYLLFYLACGFLASASHILTNVNSTIPTIGASGAISGVLGAYLLLYPRARVLTLIVFGFLWRTLYIPAAFMLGFWFLFQVLSGSMAGSQDSGGVAFWAHVGGFVAGMLLVGLFKKRKVHFFHPARYRRKTFGLY